MSPTPEVLDDTIVLSGEHAGVTIIPAGTVLTRLNYFDGKLLRSDDLRVEQDYMRTLAWLGNVAGGSGVVHGFDATQPAGSDDTLALGPGLAISPSGRPLVLGRQVALDLQRILDRSTRVAPRRSKAISASSDSFDDCVEIAATTGSSSDVVVQATQLWVIAIGAADALCGHEDVYGKLCEEACVTATDRPYRLEGIAVVALPLRLTVPLATSTAVSLGGVHQRSLVASAAFETERRASPDLRSRTGLESGTWCLGARLPGGDDLVPVALVARAGTATLFLDPWTVRRERMETPPRRYWQPPMGMRPWDVFLAQVLQFQCQLRDGLGGGTDPGTPVDPCAGQQSALDDAAQYLGEIAARFTGGDAEALAAAPQERPLPGGESRLGDIRHKLLVALREVRGGAGRQVLIDRGIVELPPAGFLPVVPGTTQTVDTQVRALMGPGVDLRFCVTRPDVVAHTLEEAQHMDRISLLAGLDQPAAPPEVDVLVPDGELVTAADPASGLGFDMTLQLAPVFAAAVGRRAAEGASMVGPFLAEGPTQSTVALHGAARADGLSTGGGTFRFAGITELARGVKGQELIRALGGLQLDGSGARKIADLKTIRSVDVSERRFDAEFAMRMRALGAEAERVNAERRAALGPAPSGDQVAAGVPAGAFDVRLEGAVVSLWLDATVDRDPFALGPHESTPVRVLADLSTPSRHQTVLRFELRGELLVDDVVPADRGGRRVSGRLRALGFRDTVVNGAQTPGQSGEVGVAVTVTRQPDEQGNPSVELLVHLDESSTLRIGGVGSGSGRPLSIRVLAAHQRGGDGRLTAIADAHLQEDTSVAEPASVAHRLSRSALELLAVGLGDLEFASANGRLLFPPARAPSGQSTVRATHDWVLFHRRRTITCAGAEQAAPQPVAPVRLEVYALSVHETRSLKPLMAALVAGAEGKLGGLSLQDIGRVEFTGGTAELATRVADIQADWLRANPGEQLLYGAIGESTAATEDPSLVRARLSRVIDAITPISAPSRELRTDQLASVPASLAVPGTDGVIVLASLVERRTTCQTVFRIDNNSRQQFKDLLDAGDPQPAFDIAMKGGGGKPLGQVTFTEGEATIDGEIDAVKDAWSKFLPQVVQTVAVFSKAGDAAAGDQPLRERRGGAIATALGQHASVSALEIEGTLPDECPAIAILVPPVEPPAPLTCHTVGLLTDREAIRAFRNALNAKDTNAMLEASRRAEALAVVHFNADTPKAPDEDLDKLRKAFHAINPPDLSSAFAFSKQGDDAQAGNAGLLKERVNVIAEALGQDPEIVIVEAEGGVHDHCPVLTVLLPG